MSLVLRAIMKFLFGQAKLAKNIHTEMLQTLGEKCPTYSTLKNWISRFKAGHFTKNDEPHSGHPPTSTDPVTCNSVHELIIQDWQLSTQKIAQTLDVSWEHVALVTSNILDMHKLPVKWFPKWLNSDRKKEWVEASRAILARFEDAQERKDA